MIHRTDETKVNPSGVTPFNYPYYFNKQQIVVTEK